MHCIVKLPVFVASEMFFRFWWEIDEAVCCHVGGVKVVVADILLYQHVDETADLGVKT